jgi:uncharacterized protein (DUF58 family)
VSAAPAARAPLRWRPRAYLLVGLGVALLFFAVGIRNPVPVFLAVPLLVAPLAAGLAAPSGTLSAPLRWSDEGSGPQVELTGTLEGDPSAGLEDWVVAVDEPTPLPEAAAPTVEARPGRFRFTLHWIAPEPTLLRVPAPAIAWRDPAGLVERPVRGDRPDLLVERYPPELLRLGAIRLERTVLLPGETRSHRLGPSGEFFGIREAAPTDPPGRINWKASARAGRRLVNEFELDRSADLLVLMDVRPTPLGPTLDDRLLGISRAGALGIANACLREKLRVGYATFGEFVDGVPLSLGRIHQRRVHEAIMATRRASVEGPSERCAVALRRLYPSTITTLLISPLVGDSALELVPHLRRRGFPVVVLSPSPLPLDPRDPPLREEEERLASRLGQLERRQRLGETWVHAPVVDWEDFWSLTGLVRMLRRPVVRRGA